MHARLLANRRLGVASSPARVPSRPVPFDLGCTPSRPTGMTETAAVGVNWYWWGMARHDLRADVSIMGAAPTGCTFAGALVPARHQLTAAPIPFIDADEWNEPFAHHLIDGLGAPDPIPEQRS